MADKKREESKESVVKVAKEHEVKFIDMWLADILGILKIFSTPEKEGDGKLLVIPVEDAVRVRTRDSGGDRHLRI